MRHSIKQDVVVRIALIFLMVIISGIVTVTGMGKVKRLSQSTEEWTEIHALVLTAEKAHYGWVENLCSAAVIGTEFTGSKDYKTCVLGKWFYDPSSSKIPNDQILQLVEQMKPIHQAIHESAQTVLDLSKTDQKAANDMYLNTTKANVEKLVGLLDQVAEITDKQVTDNQAGLLRAVATTKLVSLLSVLVTLVVSVLLVVYVMNRIVKPLQIVTESSRSLSEGNLNFQIDINSKDEIGVLADSLNSSV